MNMSIIKLPEVKKKTGLSRSTIYKKIRDKEFPSQITLGERSTGWISSEIDQWIQDRINESREPNVRAAR